MTLDEQELFTHLDDDEPTTPADSTVTLYRDTETVTIERRGSTVRTVYPAAPVAPGRPAIRSIMENYYRDDAAAQARITEQVAERAARGWTIADPGTYARTGDLVAYIFEPWERRLPGHAQHGMPF